MLVNHFKDRDGFIYLPRPEHAPRKGAIYKPKRVKKIHHPRAWPGRCIIISKNVLQCKDNTIN